MTRLVVALTLAFLAGLASQPAEARSIRPANDCANVPGFGRIWSGLRRAVARRDAAYILSVTADDITLSRGLSPGRAEFARQWDLARPAISPIWPELGRILRLGCAQDRDGAIWIPRMSLLARNDPGDRGVTRAVILGPAVPLRAAPSTRARAIFFLNWNVVAVEQAVSGDGWSRISFNGRRGYVRLGQLRGLAAHHAVFSRRNGRWQMTMFATGN